MSLEKNLALYSWHGRHHVAHITELRKKIGVGMNWLPASSAAGPELGFVLTRARASLLSQNYVN